MPSVYLTSSLCVHVFCLNHLPKCTKKTALVTSYLEILFSLLTHVSLWINSNGQSHEWLEVRNVVEFNSFVGDAIAIQIALHNLFFSNDIQLHITLTWKSRNFASYLKSSATSLPCPAYSSFLLKYQWRFIKDEIR